MASEPVFRFHDSPPNLREPISLANVRDWMTFQRMRNGRKLLVGRPGIEPGTP